MIGIRANATTRICPQMSQMFTDEEEHLCPSVSICGSVFFTSANAEGLAGTMIQVRSLTE